MKFPWDAAVALVASGAALIWALIGQREKTVRIDLPTRKPKEPKK